MQQQAREHAGADVDDRCHPIHSGDLEVSFFAKVNFSIAKPPTRDWPLFCVRGIVS
jgi:hypothetical protein